MAGKSWSPSLSPCDTCSRDVLVSLICLSARTLVEVYFDLLQQPSVRVVLWGGRWRAGHWSFPSCAPRQFPVVSCCVQVAEAGRGVKQGYEVPAPQGCNPRVPSTRLAFQRRVLLLWLPAGRLVGVLQTAPDSSTLAARRLCPRRWCSSLRRGPSSRWELWFRCMVPGQSSVPRPCPPAWGWPVLVGPAGREEQAGAGRGEHGSKCSSAAPGSRDAEQELPQALGHPGTPVPAPGRGGTEQQDLRCP